MLSQKLIKPIALVAAAIAVGGGAYGIIGATAGNGSGAATTASSSSATSSATPCRPRRRIQRSIRTGRRGINRHGQQRVQVEFHTLDFSRSEGDRQEGLVHDVQEGDKPDIGECH